MVGGLCGAKSWAPTTEADAIAWLVAQAPVLRPLLDEHVAFHRALLSYVVFESDFVTARGKGDGALSKPSPFGDSASVSARWPGRVG